MTDKTRERIYPRKTDKVLMAAEELFLRLGYEKTSMQAVATAAGVAKTTVYSNFSGKDVLFAAVIRRRAIYNAVGTEEIDVSSTDVASTLVALAVAFLGDIYSREQVELFQTVTSDSRRFPELGALMIEGGFLETHGRIMAYLAKLVEDGTLSASDPRMLGEYFIALIKADKHIKLLLSQPIDVSAPVVKTIAEGAVHIFLHGARPRHDREDDVGSKVIS